MNEITVPCPACDGRGKYYTPLMEGIQCPQCKGTGRVQDKQVTFEGYTFLPSGVIRRIRVRALWTANAHKFPWTVEDLSKDTYESYSEVHIRGLSWTVTKELESGTRVAWIETEAELWVK